VKIVVMPTYSAKCLEPVEIRVPKERPRVILQAYRVKKELEFVSRAQIKIDEHPVIAYKKFEKFLEECEIALLRTEKGRGFREVLVYKKKPPGNILMFTKPSPLKGIIILKKQEEGEREENVLFARNLIREYYPAENEGLVFVGDIRFLEQGDGENVVGIGLETDNGIRYLMKTELKEHMPRPYIIIRSNTEESSPQGNTITKKDEDKKERITKAEAKKEKKIKRKKRKRKKSSKKKR